MPKLKIGDRRALTDSGRPNWAGHEADTHWDEALGIKRAQLVWTEENDEEDAWYVLDLENRPAFKELPLIYVVEVISVQNLPEGDKCVNYGVRMVSEHGV